jgi:hypothetical protein
VGFVDADTLGLLGPWVLEDVSFSGGGVPKASIVDGGDV